MSSGIQIMFMSKHKSWVKVVV